MANDGGGPFTSGHGGPRPSRRLGNYSSESEEAPLITANTQADDGAKDEIVRIRIPEDENLLVSDLHQLYPKERGKTLLAVGMLLCASIWNNIVNSIIHEKVPEYPPLPDFVFSLTPYFPYGLVITEYIMISCFCSLLLLILFHRHRWIVLRRVAVIGSLLYFGRCVTMFVTQVPVADPQYYCSPKLKGENAAFTNLLLRGLKSVMGLGLNIDGKHSLCGDYIFRLELPDREGTVTNHFFDMLQRSHDRFDPFIGEYSPRRWKPLHYAVWLLAIAGMFLLIISRGHYTIDVIISYFLCTRLFYCYHTMIAHPNLRISPHNHHRKECWFPLFDFMEGRIARPLPRRFDCPIPADLVRSLLSLRTHYAISNFTNLFGAIVYRNVRRPLRRDWEVLHGDGKATMEKQILLTTKLPPSQIVGITMNRF